MGRAGVSVAGGPGPLASSDRGGSGSGLAPRLVGQLRRLPAVDRDTLLLGLTAATGGEPSA